MSGWIQATMQQNTVIWSEAGEHPMCYNFLSLWMSQQPTSIDSKMKKDKRDYFYLYVVKEYIFYDSKPSLPSFLGVTSESTWP